METHGFCGFPHQPLYFLKKHSFLEGAAPYARGAPGLPSEATRSIGMVIFCNRVTERY